MLVKDGYLSEEQYGAKGILSREELFAVLRSNKVEQLGQVKRAYMEQTGQISVFIYDRPEVKPGLALIPPWDLGELPRFEVEEPVVEPGPYACWTCGFTKEYEADEVFTYCPNCEHGRWTRASKEPLTVAEQERTVGGEGQEQ